MNWLICRATRSKTYDIQGWQASGHIVSTHATGPQNFMMALNMVYHQWASEFTLRSWITCKSYGAKCFSQETNNTRFSKTSILLTSCPQILQIWPSTHHTTTYIHHLVPHHCAYSRKQWEVQQKSLMAFDQTLWYHALCCAPTLGGPHLYGKCSSCWDQHLHMTSSAISSPIGEVGVQATWASRLVMLSYGVPKTGTHIFFAFLASLVLYCFVSEALGLNGTMNLSEFLETQANQTGRRRWLFWLFFAAMTWTFWTTCNRMVIERVFLR